MLQKFRRSSRRCNQTCVQNAQLYLTFHEAGEWRRGARSPWVCFRRQKSVMPEDVRALAAYTHARMQRVAGMMAVLLALHDDWGTISSSMRCWQLATPQTISFCKLNTPVNGACCE